MFFNKKQEAQAPKEPQLQGEDFEIFPTVGEYSYSNSTESAEGAQAAEAAPEEEPEPTPFQQRIAAIPEDKWKKLQVLAGIVLGVLSGLFISFFSFLSDFFTSWGLIFAVVLALVLPNQFEKRAARQTKRMRTAIIISLGSVFALYLLYIYVINPTALDALRTTT